MSDGASFFQAFLRAPRTIGAVASSGPALASRMVQCAELDQGHCVVEIGAGQGPMTAVLVEQGHPPALVFELYEQWADVLASRFPDLCVVQQSAADMPSVLEARKLPPADRVVSSLPWAIWPDALQDTILRGVIEGMQPNGRMVTFTYVHGRWLPAARRFRRKLGSQFRSVTTSSIVWKNLPPAVVYQCDL